MKKSKLIKEWKDSLQVRFDSLLDELEKLESKRDMVSYKFRKDIGHSSRDEYHNVCEQIRKIVKKLESIEPFLQDKFYMTRYSYSDRDAYEVVKIITPNKFLVRELKATLTHAAKEKLQKSFIPGGFFGHFDNGVQEWEFESDDSNPLIEVRRHKDGRYYEANARTIPFIACCKPYKFYDYNF